MCMYPCSMILELWTSKVEMLSLHPQYMCGWLAGWLQAGGKSAVF